MISKIPKVLVVVVYTDYKEYCKFLYPAMFERLTYPNKELCLITDQELPGLSELPTGELIAARGRQYGIEKALEGNFDYILQLDYDVEPPVDTIEKLLFPSVPLIGGAVASRSDANSFIGHNYSNREKLTRRSISYGKVGIVETTDGVAGGCLLISRDIFKEVDYKKYKGPDTIPGRFTADDEFFQIEVYNKLGIIPKCSFYVRPWHYHDDGWAYRLWGEKKYWRSEHL